MNIPCALVSYVQLCNVFRVWNEIHGFSRRTSPAKWLALKYIQYLAVCRQVLGCLSSSMQWVWAGVELNHNWDPRVVLLFATKSLSCRTDHATSTVLIITKLQMLLWTTNICVWWRFRKYSDQCVRRWLQTSKVLHTKNIFCWVPGSTKVGTYALISTWRYAVIIVSESHLDIFYLFILFYIFHRFDSLRDQMTAKSSLGQVMTKDGQKSILIHIFLTKKVFCDTVKIAASPFET